MGLISIFSKLKAAIREEISGMSIEELLALKEKIGSKMFDQGLGLAKKSSYKDKFKRENKNRPRMEPISKRPVKRSQDVVGVKSEAKKQFRDPRFDPLCGEYDEKVSQNFREIKFRIYSLHILYFDEFLDFQRLLQIRGRDQGKRAQNLEKGT